MGKIKLAITEKSSLAKAVAEALGNYKKFSEGYICGEKQDIIVLPASGHLLRLPEPEEYGIPEGEEGNNGLKAWKAETLPIMPEDMLHPDWRIADARAAKLLSAIAAHLPNAEVVYHIGDPDREGQLIVDNILLRLNYQGEVLRILPESITPEFLRGQFRSPKKNAEYTRLSEAALARSMADMLLGINLSRAFTIAAQRCGRRQKLLYGRVMTPTLNLVVMRDRAIENFKSETFFTPRATFVHANGEFTTKWVCPSPEDFDGLSLEGNLIDSTQRDAILAAVQADTGKITTAGPKKHRERPPLPYNLPDIQKEAFTLYKIQVDKTLEILQSLYEAKLTTYPRSDCNYLHDTQHAEAPAILKGLESLQYEGASLLNPGQRHAAFDSDKVSAHTAIIPTGEKPVGLTDEQSKIYHLVAMAYWRLFLPDREYEEEVVVVASGGFQWQVKSARELSPGWTVTGDGRSLAGGIIPSGMKPGDSVTCKEAFFDEGKTTPPKRFTQATLLEAMRNIHKIETNPEYKKRLKETSGLGTPATQAEIITKLPAQGYVQVDAKGSYVSTAGAREFMDSIPEELKSPGLTAVWEDKFSHIIEKSLSLSTFFAEFSDTLSDYCQKALVMDVRTGRFEGAVCPGCGKTCMCLKTKAGDIFWDCSWCNKKFADNDGKPGDETGKKRVEPCAWPGCTGEMARKLRKETRMPFWVCETCGHFFREKDGNVVAPVTCPVCNTGVAEYFEYEKEGAATSTYWKCAGCNTNFFDNNGQIGAAREPAITTACVLPGCSGKMTRYTSKDNPDQHYWYCKTCNKAVMERAEKEPVKPEPCPVCENGVMICALSKKGDLYWRCCTCEKMMSDKDGKPGGEICPICQKKACSRIYSAKMEKFFWRCAACEAFFNDDGNGSILKVPTAPCPLCGKMLSQMTWEDSKYWKCKDCEESFDNVNDLPQKKNQKPCPYPDCKGKISLYQPREDGGNPYWRCGTCKRYANEYNGEILKPGKCTEKKCSGIVIGGVSKTGNPYFKCEKCGTFYENDNGKMGKAAEKKKH